MESRRRDIDRQLDCVRKLYLICKTIVGIIFARLLVNSLFFHCLGKTLGSVFKSFIGGNKKSVFARMEKALTRIKIVIVGIRNRNHHLPAKNAMDRRIITVQFNSIYFFAVQ